MSSPLLRSFLVIPSNCNPSLSDESHKTHNTYIKIKSMLGWMQSVVAVDGTLLCYTARFMLEFILLSNNPISPSLSWSDGLSVSLFRLYVYHVNSLSLKLSECDVTRIPRTRSHMYLTPVDSSLCRQSFCTSGKFLPVDNKVVSDGKLVEEPMMYFLFFWWEMVKSYSLSTSH